MYEIASIIEVQCMGQFRKLLQILECRGRV